jgi:hypothetical protein
MVVKFIMWTSITPGICCLLTVGRLFSTVVNSFISRSESTHVLSNVCAVFKNCMLPTNKITAYSNSEFI